MTIVLIFCKFVGGTMVVVTIFVGNSSWVVSGVDGCVEVAPCDGMSSMWSLSVE